MDSNIAEPLFAIESQHPALQDVRYRNYNVWAIIRFLLRIQLANPEKQTEIGFKKRLSDIKWGFIHLALLIKELLVNNSKWFAKYDVIVFSNRFEKRLLNGKMIDKLTSGIIESCELKGWKVLVVNYGDLQNKQNISFQSSYQVNGRKLYHFLQSSIPSFFTSYKRKLLVKELKASGPPANYNNIVNDLDQYIWGIELFKRLYKRWKPRFVFMPDYSGFAEIYAANIRGIKTVELQHGNINSFHPGYVTTLSIDRNFYANYLLVFGENSFVKDTKAIYKQNEVFVAGNYYLEKLEQLSLNTKLKDLIKKFRTSVCIPYDITDEKFIFEFVKSIVATSQDVIFIFSIRYEVPAKLLELKATYSNVHIESELPFQEIVRCCDFNTCSFSTCAIEAPSLGKRNILIATDPRTKLYFENKLNSDHTFYASTPEEYRAILNNLITPLLSAEEIKYGNAKNIATGYEKNIEHFFSTINIS